MGNIMLNMLSFHPGWGRGGVGWGPERALRAALAATCGIAWRGAALYVKGGEASRRARLPQARPSSAPTLHLRSATHSPLPLHGRRA